jgi:hypothetical protein
MKALVTGLSKSKYWSNDYDLIVGVNDCKFPVDDLVSCDHPRVFNAERLKVIVANKAEMYTHIRDWGELRDITLIELAPIRSDVSCLTGRTLYAHSICSPYIAVVHAFYKGATEIHLAGVDLVGHQHLGKDENIAKSRKDFRALQIELLKQGCKLKLIRSIPDGAMLGVLPLADGFEYV